MGGGVTLLMDPFAVVHGYLLPWTSSRWPHRGTTEGLHAVSEPLRSAPRGAESPRHVASLDVLHSSCPFRVSSHGDHSCGSQGRRPLRPHCDDTCSRGAKKCAVRRPAASNSHERAIAAGEGSDDEESDTSGLAPEAMAEAAASTGEASPAEPRPPRPKPRPLNRRDAGRELVRQPHPPSPVGRSKRQGHPRRRAAAPAAARGNRPRDCHQAAPSSPVAAEANRGRRPRGPRPGGHTSFCPPLSRRLDPGRQAAPSKCPRVEDRCPASACGPRGPDFLFVLDLVNVRAALANVNHTPNPSKAPLYFLGCRSGRCFHPWRA